MKTLFICSVKRINYHVGEEYDDFIEVSDVPMADTIDEWAHRIQGRIRKLWEENEKEKNTDKRVVAAMDANYSYYLILEHLKKGMLTSEKIVVELPPEPSENTTDEEKE